jgi:hypothetical protein
MTILSQLVDNGEAAINAVEGILIEKSRCRRTFVWAFMVANLLTHSNLLRGIARSGAYNRTLTPWLSVRAAQLLEVPEIYNTMSPFMNANKMKTRFYWCMKPIIILEHSLYKRSAISKH